MSTENQSLYDLMQRIDALLVQAMRHQDSTQQDKATLVLAGVHVAEVRRRHMARWTPFNPATLPPRKPGQAFPQLPKGWLGNWEDQKEAGNG